MRRTDSRSRAKVWLVLGLVVLPLLTSTPGCTTSSTPANHDRATFLDNPAGKPDGLAEARGLIEAGQYSQAIPKLLAVLDGAPNKAVASEAHYQLAVAYESIQSLRDAADHYEDYLTLAPAGPYADASNAALARLSAGAGADSVTDPSQMQDRARALETAGLATGGELGRRLELADLYWRLERYGDAGALYGALLKEQPGLAGDMTIRNRIAVEPDGTVTVLTPEEVARRAYEADPLLIYNTSSYRSGRQAGFTRTFQEVFYHVTGEAVNRGAKALANVQLNVTIYGFGNRILDTQVVQMGTLPPGARRPFSVRFTNFDDIENVDRFEVKGSYVQ